MKSRFWILIVGSVLTLTICSFLFFFPEGKSSPQIWNIPFAFWTSFLVTCLIVVLTFIGSRVFPYQETNQK